MNPTRGFVTAGLALFVPDFETPISNLYTAAVKGALTTSLVAYVIFFGILLYHLKNESGVMQTIASYIAHSTKDPKGKGKVVKNLRSTFVQATPVIGSTLFYVVLSEMMAAPSMTDTLAHAAAALFGGAFLFVSPVIGGMGG
ncbi:hypothetical protein [Brevibacillus borstelensis]|uniref:hypothetical protein n=1 Tax=Brevibacillus borstelensis TaxID=45462 RepID=UPI0030C4829B